ncbi:unnamed protein product [Lampetra fluviatilis]
MPAPATRTARGAMKMAAAGGAAATKPKMAGSLYAAGVMVAVSSETPRGRPWSSALGTTSRGRPGAANHATKVTRLSSTVRRDSICSATHRQHSSTAGIASTLASPRSVAPDAAAVATSGAVAP